MGYGIGYKGSKNKIAEEILNSFRRQKRCSLLISYSEGNEMDHVSGSPMNRFTVPTWEDMCALKEICFYPEEECYQVHPKQSEYLHGVGDLENVLHIWHPVNNRTIDDLAKLPDLPGEKATT